MHCLQDKKPLSKQVRRRRS